MTIANTKQGKVEGVEKLGCLQFRGIPYAAPPVGELRWMPPRPAEAWDGTRDASAFGPICPQVDGMMSGFAGGRSARPSLPASEDCLTLNVWTPALDDALRPVMVWLHGGAFTSGSGRIPWYSGHTFARDGVVVVTINYRLAGFGFLELEELFGPRFADSGSLGIADQVLALEWVRDNISSFGGDPANVTIFGESAGGASVGTLLATPSAKGLFGKAIPQSGAAHWSNPKELATLLTRAFCERAGVKPGDVDALYALDADTIVDVAVGLEGSVRSGANPVFGDDFGGSGLPFQPISGSDFLPRAPIDAIADGAAAGIPTLVGTTLEEFKLFSMGVPDDALGALTGRPLHNMCAGAGRSANDVVSAYKNAGRSPRDVLDAVETDRSFRIPAIRLAEAQIAHGTPTWMYRFDWRSPAFDGKLGAGHVLEIPFVFDNLDGPGVDIFTGGAGPAELARSMHAAWVAFGKTGDPNAPELPQWPRYDNDRRATMLFNERNEVADDPAGDERAVWDGVI